MKNLFIIVALVASTSLFANDTKWVCMKDGKAAEVKGEKAEQKKAACEAVKGQWMEAKAEEKKQEAGKSAGW